MRSLKDEIIKAGETYELKNLAIKGEDLIARGIKPGQEMGQLLENMLDKVMRNPELNTKDKLLSLVCSEKDQAETNP